jgi:soluble lytic murein transglycosylase
MAVKYFFKLALLVGLLFFARWLPRESLDQQRPNFLRAEQLLEQGHDAAFLELSETLSDYPLYPHLQFEWLKKHLQKTDKVTEFLARFNDTRYAPLLRAKWLDYLAKHNRWPEFVDNYQGTENPSRECYYYWGLYETGKKDQALAEAKHLWLTGESRPQACDALFVEFIKSPAFSPALVWQRFALAVNEENWPLVDYLRRYLDEPAQKMADFWVQVHKTPILVKDSSLWINMDALTGRIYADGIARLAAFDVDMALRLWDGRKLYLSLDNQVVDDVDRKLALALFNRRDVRAYPRLQQVRLPDERVQEAKVRAALFEQNWQHVLEALAGLPADGQQEPAWRYWRARALEAQGKSQQSQAVYVQLADDRSFYGFLAADKLERGYAISDQPIEVNDNDFDTLLDLPDFKAVQEWRELGRDLEARRQWLFAIGRLDKTSLKIAAKLAQQWNWDQIAIMTLVKADYWDDMAVRFPLRYVDDVRTNASRQQIDPAIIFGLIRQESMLDSKAASTVGARGLMQLMPTTAAQVAGKLNEVWHSDDLLFRPDLNIRYGSYYFAELLQRFDGHLALAIAAYNAGPNRAAKWLPVGHTLPADIWIETIPYKETRKYVTSVLSYAIIYQYRLQTEALKIKNMLPQVPANEKLS